MEQEIDRRVDLLLGVPVRRPKGPHQIVAMMAPNQRMIIALFRQANALQTADGRT
jgi:hypothetical protein